MENTYVANGGIKMLFFMQPICHVACHMALIKKKKQKSTFSLN